MTIAKSQGGYVIVIENTGTGYSAHAPDLPGCIATGRTQEQTEKRMDEAILIHQKGMKEDGHRVPRPRSLAELRRKRLL
jgi:predicted RNase H-like HicB family nuclease